MKEYADDIPYALALASQCGTSVAAEKHAASEIAKHAELMHADYTSLLRHADTDEKLILLDAEFDRFHAEFVALKRSYLESRSGIVLTLIAGPAAFTVSYMDTFGEVVFQRLTEMLEFRELALQAIARKLRPTGHSVMAGDSEAVTQLEAQIRQAERRHQFCEKANAIVRRKPKNQLTDEKLVELLGLGFTDERVRRLFDPGTHGWCGIPCFEFTNSRANIHRMKLRLLQLQREHLRKNVTVECEHATIEDRPADHRVRLFFPANPAKRVRERLKSCGFRWAPTLGCWQAFRLPKALATAREVAGNELAVPTEA